MFVPSTTLKFLTGRRPFIIDFARPSRGLLWGDLISILISLSIVTTIHMEITQAFFDSISSLGMLLSKDSPDPIQCILSGIQNKNEYYRVRQTFLVSATGSLSLLQHLAYLELAHIAKKGPSNRRVEIFTDQKTPSSWNKLSRECLLLLGQHYAHLHRRGAPAPPPGLSFVHTKRDLLTKHSFHSRISTRRGTSGTLDTPPLRRPPRTNLPPDTKILPGHIHQRPCFLDLSTTLDTLPCTSAVLNWEHKPDHPLDLCLQGPAEGYRSHSCTRCRPCTARPCTIVVAT
jgi:Nucleoporin protein Ndc1-Nup